MTLASLSYLSQLRQLLSRHFDLAELRGICFDLGINHENLSPRLDELARELIELLDRQQRLPELLNRVKQQRPTVDWGVLPQVDTDETPPFKGLQFFDEADAALFFGRDALTAVLLDHLNQHRFLAVVGASGSGKSSIVRAGLLPALRRGDVTANGRTSDQWPIHLITPGDEPLKALAATLTRDSESVTATKTLLADLQADTDSLDLWLFRQMADGGGRILLVIDQFEELFTQCRNDGARQQFINNLAQAVQSGQQGRLSLIITLRADFYAHALQYECLRPLLETRQKIIGAMTPTEIEQAILKPAETHNWHFQPGLVAAILEDVGSEPGALPLLSHALLETWKRREGRELTLAGYQAAGGVRKAIATTADDLLAQLSPDEREVARSIFVRLTNLGEGTADTRRRTSLAELTPQGFPEDVVQHVLDTLTDARLVTTDEESAEVAHEALIREWPQLRAWLDADREGLRIQRQLTDAAEDWQNRGHDPEYLYPRGRLAQAQEWAGQNPGQLTELEHQFLLESQAVLDHEAAQKEAARQRELAQAQRLVEAQQRRVTIIRRALAGLILLLIIAIGASIIAAQQAKNARAAEQRALAGDLSFLAQNLADRDPELATLLALEAVNRTDGAGINEEANLRQLLPDVPFSHTFSGHEGPVQQARFSQDDSLVVTSSADGSARVWDVATGQELLNLSHPAPVNDAVFSPDDRQIVTAAEDGLIRLWDVQQGSQLSSWTAHEGGVISIQFNPKGDLLLSGGADGYANLWHRDDSSLLYALDAGAAVTSAVFDPTGQLIATSTAGGSVIIWNAATGSRVNSSDGWAYLSSVSFSADGKSLLVGDYYSYRVRTFAVDALETLGQLTPQHTWVLNDVSYGPDRFAVTASGDGTARLWALDGGITGSVAVLRGHRGEVNSAQFSHNGRFILTSGDDGTARLWDFDRWRSRHLFCDQSYGSNNYIARPSFSPDGQLIAGGCSGTILAFWDAASGKARQFLERDDNIYNGLIESARFSPDGKTVAAAYWDGVVVLWDVATGERTGTLELRPVESQYPIVHFAAFSPDGRLIAAVGGAHAGTVDTSFAEIWDVATGQRRWELLGHTGWVASADFSPDGQLLVTSGSDGQILVWNTETGDLVHSMREPGVVGRAVFSPDGQLIASAGTDNTAHLWDVATGQEVAALFGHTAEVTWLAFTPDGGRLITASRDYTVRVWNVSSGESLFVLDQRATDVMSIAVSPDGRQVLIAALDGFGHLQFLTRPDLLVQARQAVSRELTCAEQVLYLHEEHQCD